VDGFELLVVGCFCLEVEALELVFPFIVAWMLSDISLFSSSKPSFVFVLDEDEDFAVHGGTRF
jgi:hypothetical protein